MTYNKEKMTFYFLASIAVTLFGILLGPSLIPEVDASHCSTSTHCYANYKNISFNTNYGVKADVTAANVYAPCGSTHHFTSVPTWMNFGGNPAEWLEIGYYTGWINTDTSCQTGDVFYYYTKIDNIPAKANLGTITNGNTYALKIERTTTNEEWKIYLNGSLKRTESGTGFNTGRGEAGGEMTDHNGIIDKADFNNVQRKTSTSSTSWTNWLSSSASAVTQSSPPYRSTCASFWHFAVGTSAGTTCV